MSYRIWIVVIAFVALLAARPLAAVVIPLSDGSKFDVQLLYVTETRWAYLVKEVEGKNLSHLVLILGACSESIFEASPAGYVVGLDGSTGMSGIKWNVDDDFTEGVFAVTLGSHFPMGEIEVLVKAGNDYGTALVYGPICDLLPPPDDPQQDPTETPTATEQGGTIPPATATNTPGNNGTIPPATNTPQNGTIPPATATATATDQGGTIPPAPTATATNAPGQPTATNTAVPVTVTVIPPTVTPTAPGSTPQAPTATPTMIVITLTPSPTPTAHPESEPVQWLPIVQDCGFGDNGFLDCGR